MIAVRRFPVCLAVLSLVLAAAADGAEEEQWKRVLKGDDAKKAAELQNQMDELTGAGKFAEAVKPAEELLALRRRVQGDKHWETINARVQRDTWKHLAAQPAGIQQDFQTASRQNKEAVRLAQRRRYADAEPLFREAMAFSRKVLGEQHPNTAVSLYNLAVHLQDQGKYADAEPLCRQALAIQRKTLGEQHPHTAASLNILARSLVSQYQYADAETLYRQALAINRQTMGEHTDTALSLYNLADNLNAQGKYAEGESFYRQSLAIYRRVIGEQHPLIASRLSNLAGTLSAQGKYAEAEPLLRLALAIQRKASGEQDLTTARRLGNLALILSRQGKYAEAESLYQQALLIESKGMKEQNLATATTLGNVAGMWNSQGKYADAEPLCRQVLAIIRKAVGEQNPHTATRLSNLAVVLNNQGKYAEAEPLSRQALAIRHKFLGDSHPNTATSLNNLAINLDNQGKHAEAEPLFRRSAVSFEMARLRVGTSGFGRAPFGADNSPFPSLAAFLARLNKSSDAWRAAESGLARGLLDDLAPPLKLDPRQRARVVRLDQLDRLLLPLLTAKELKDAEKTRRDELSKERDALQAELARDAAELSRREVYSLERIQKQLCADVAFIFWIDVRNSPKPADPNGDHWACVVRHTGSPAWFHLPGSGDKDAWTESDTRLPDRLHRSLAAGESDWDGLARRLARQRLAPLESALGARGDLPAVRRLIVAPAGWMASVPLEALTNRYTISYAPSGTVYTRLREQHRSLNEPSLLVLGDPAFTVPNSPLPPPLPDHGLLLTLVQPDGNAAKAGLRSGDVLLRYGDRKLTTSADVKLVANSDLVPVQVWRDGKTLDLRVAPGKLGVAIHRDPAPAAIRQKREFDAALSVPRGEWKPLPGSRREVKALQSLFSKATVLLGSDASEQRLDKLVEAKRLQDFRVLHFATHGKVDAASADRSALLVARDKLPDVEEQARLGRKIYDGRLTVASIASTWQLDADLVTLSACETALGPRGGGDGLLGFSQILFQKGARGLLLSLWKVDDTATALLMQRFYENWLGKRKDLKAPLPKAEALREAKEWLRQLPVGDRDRLASGLRGEEVPAKPVVRPAKETTDKPYAHPRYWAAFILIGDPE